MTERPTDRPPDQPTDQPRRRRRRRCRKSTNVLTTRQFSIKHSCCASCPSLKASAAVALGSSPSHVGGSQCWKNECVRRHRCSLLLLLVLVLVAITVAASIGQSFVYRRLTDVEVAPRLSGGRDLASVLTRKAATVTVLSMLVGQSVCCCEISLTLHQPLLQLRAQHQSKTSMKLSRLRLKEGEITYANGALFLPI
jgi:hypothetical protein